MYSFKRYICLALAFLLSLSVLLVSCGTTEENKPALSATTEGVSDKTGEAAATSSAPAAEPPAKIKMFFGDAGIQFPSDIDKSNNPFLEIIEKAANVDLEMIQPPYADFQTQFNLMMASGELPDIVHCWFKADIDKYGSEGAFIDWNDYLPKSPQLSQFYTKDMLDQMKTADGSVYALNVLSAMDPNGTYARIDLIDEVNGGVMPKTPDDWYQIMKKVKEKYPDSVPMSTQGGIMMADYFFKAFGVGIDGNGIKLQVLADTPDKYIWGFQAPKAREAVEFHRRLYTEGLLDRTFVTNKYTEYANAVETKNTIIFWGGVAEAIKKQDRFASIGNTTAVAGFVNNPIAPGVNPQDCYQPMSPIGWHCVSISGKSGNIDASVRVIEAFTLPEVKEGIAWGREGIEYVKNADGRRILDTEASALANYRTAYCFFNSYWYPDNLDVKAAQLYPKLAGPQATAFRKAYTEGVAIRDKESGSVPPFTAASFVPSNAELAPKLAEARAASLNIIFKAIIGEISMDEYDKQVNEFIKKYEFITNDYTQALQKVIAERK